MDPTILATICATFSLSLNDSLVCVRVQRYNFCIQSVILYVMEYAPKQIE